MANRAVHLTGGTLAGAGTAAYLARNQTPGAFVIEAAGGALGGYATSLAPDWIEPAIHSWHRSTAHSYMTASAMTAAATRSVRKAQSTCRARADTHAAEAARATSTAARLWHQCLAFFWRFLSGIVAGLPAGYLSHLALDAVTPRGIPLIA